MSTATLTPVSMSARIGAAFRLHFTVPNAYIYVPLMVFLGSTALSYGIGLWLYRGVDGGSSALEPAFSGAGQATIWTLGFMAAYSVSHTLPFSMALSFSRRTFVMGSLAVFTAVSLAFGVAVLLFGWLENVTDGFGVYMYTFNLPFLTDNGAGVWGAAAFAAALCLLAMLIGFAAALVYRQLSILLFWVLGLLLVAAAVVVIVMITTLDGWPTVLTWLGQQNGLTMAAWSLVPSVLLVLGSWAVARRAVPQG